jgi:curli biogenesis system outer membrane secretion channel CsgG
MKRPAVLLLCCFALFGAMVFAQDADDEEAAAYTIAVLPFADGAVRAQWGGFWGGSVEWEVGAGVADMITTGLMEQAKRSGRFRVVERQRVQEVLAEQDLATTGRVDPATAARIGRLLGAQTLLMGSVTQFSVDLDMFDLPYDWGGFGGDRATARAEIDGRLVDSETGEVLAALAGSGKKHQYGVRISRGDFAGLQIGSARFERTILGRATRQAVDEMVKMVTEDLTDHRHARQFMAKRSGLVVHIDGDDVMINLGLRNGVRQGDIFQVVRQREVIRDPETGEVLKVIEDDVGTLRVRTVEEKVSTGRVDLAGPLSAVQVQDRVRLIGEETRPGRQRGEEASERG